MCPSLAWGRWQGRGRGYPSPPPHPFTQEQSSRGGDGTRRTVKTATRSATDTPPKTHAPRRTNNEMLDKCPNTCDIIKQ